LISREGSGGVRGKQTRKKKKKKVVLVGGRENQIRGKKKNQLIRANWVGGPGRSQRRGGKGPAE